MIKVGVDCWALRTNGAGARYVFESLFSIIESSKDYKFILFLHPEAETCIQEMQGKYGILKNSVKLKIDSPNEILKYEKFVDIFYSPFNNISFRYFNKPVVSVLHDVQERYLPELFSPDTLEARYEDYDDIVRASIKTITISDFCKKSIVEYCGAEEERVEIVYNAPQQSLLQYVDSFEIKSKNEYLGIKARDFIFYPANFYAHKNHKRLLEAYALCLKENSDMPKLVLMGMLWNDSDINNDIIALGLGNHVEILSNQTAEELAWLYTHCCYVIIPSLFEGFCMPAVEALAFRKLVLCSNLDILKEVTLESGLYFDPVDIDDISNMMLYGLAEKNVNFIDIENRYNWNSSANKTMELIDEAVFEYYKCPKLLNKFSESNFFVFIDAENSTLDDIGKTIFSIVRQKIKPVLIDVCLSLQRDIDKEIIDELFLKLYAAGINKVYVFTPDVESHFKKYDYYSYCVAGNSFSDNYFFNIARAYLHTNTSLLIGELHQVHEDYDETFEESVYYRINRGNLILKGSFYPEMYVSRDYDYIKSLCRDKSNLSQYVASKIAAKDSNVKRMNFGKVLFRNSRFFERSIQRKCKISYEPKDFLPEHEFLAVDKLVKDQAFIDYINNAVADKLGEKNAPDINEVKRQMEIISKERKYYE
ncbi:glycosyltransferase family 1 protein [Vreelandella sedimenti]|uniref:glycosyltransferase family 4 protein n=1 Tax=Vreelandella sedimenti TaxID=2729618 RepID=UPI0030D96C75|tara:strand:- start:5244 stop:7187 length:1944 start_codon:yes stop_codon:yes gene_type:complete